MIKLDFFTNKYTITYRSYFYLFIVLTIASSLNFYQFLNDYDNILVILVFSVFVSLASIAQLYLLQELFLKQKFNLFSILLLALAVGISRGLLLTFLMPVTGLPSQVSLTYRIINATVNTIIWLIIFIKIDTLKLEFQKRFEGIISQALIKSIRSLSDDELRLELEQIQSNLKNMDLKSQTGLLDSQVFIVAAKKVQRQIDEAIRPLSHRMWIDTKQNLPRINALNVAKETFCALDYNPLALLAIYSATTFININANMDTLGSFLITMFSVSVYLILYKIFKYLRKLNINQSLVSLLYLAALVVLPSYAVNIMLPEYVAAWPTYVEIISIVILPFYVITLSVLRLLDQDRKALTQLIEDRINADEKKSFETAQVASYLHNTLQSELLSASRTLELSALDPTSPESRRNLERLGALINRSISEDFKESYLNPEQKIKEIVNGWQGIVDINIDIPQEMLSQQGQGLLISQIIQEAATNSIKHSNAKNLFIKGKEISNGNTEITITCTNLNKNAPSSDLSKGWLASISLVKPRVIEASNSHTIVIEI